MILYLCFIIATKTQETMSQREKYDLFISYSRQDKKTVDMICNHLDTNNISYFRDIFDISISSTFTQTLADAILSCKMVLFIASKHSFASNYTSKEVTFAYQNHIAILPLLTDNTPMPTNYSFMFSDVQCMSLESTSMPRLISDIKALLAGDTIKREITIPERNIIEPQRKKRGCIATILQLIGLLVVIFFAVVIIALLSSDEEVESDNTTQTELVVLEGDYYHITGSRELTEEDIKGKTSHELRIMRNEIYARHGYIFKDPILRDYFMRKTWYKPTTISVTFNDIEQYNVRFIQQYE